MRVLFTGGTGFFGKAFLRRFLEGGNVSGACSSIAVLSRNPGRFLEENPLFRGIRGLSFLEADILHPSSLRTLNGYDLVIHAAADSTLGPQLSPLERYQQIVNGTENVLFYASRVGVRRFLFVSSGAVYGEIGSEGASEDSLAVPDGADTRNTYGIAKRAAEHLCVIHAKEFGFETVIARCFAFVGPDLPLDAHFAIGNFIRDALWGDEICVQGDGAPIRSYLYQDELAEWLECIALHGRPSMAYNVGSDEGVSILALAVMVRDTLSPRKRIKVLGNKSRGRSTHDFYLPDISRVQSELNLRVNVPLRTAIERTASIILAGSL